MARTRGPRPYRQRQASTLFLRIPVAEWAEIMCGVKREFRAAPGNSSALWNVEPPVPVVGYKVDSYGRYEARLIVLEATWREPLGAISPESIEAEGFASFAEFRRHWVLREKRYFPPLATTSVYRVRPWTPEDAQLMSDRLLGLLYGDFLDPEEGRAAIGEPTRVAR